MVALNPKIHKLPKQMGSVVVLVVTDRIRSLVSTGLMPTPFAGSVLP
jgi:hypothetical protein